MPSDDPPASRRASKIALVLLVVAMLVTAHQGGVLEQFGAPAQLKQTLVGLGGWGYLAFLVAYATLQPFGVPGTVFVWAAPLIWPWPVAFALSMTGTMAASVVGFSFARFIARDWISSRIPARFAKYDRALGERAFSTVVLLRFLFWMPPLLHAFFGVSRVPFWTHFWGSLVGYLVPLFLVSFYGEVIFDWAKNAPAHVWIGMALGFLVLLVGWQLWRRRIAARPSSAP